MANVLLLREASTDFPDRYESAFAVAGYHPISIPVLTTLHDNVERLLEIVGNGPKTKGVAGVIVTSKRSCDTWRETLRLLRESKSSYDIHGRGVAEWGEIPFYVVGEATSTAIKDVFAEFKDLGLGSPDVRGQSSGSAAILAPFILDDLKERPATLLYLTGDKNRDTISRILEKGGILLEPLQVYRTQGSPAFETDLELALASSHRECSYWWIVYFAPSAAAYVTPILRKHFHLEITETSPPSNTALHLVRTKVAAIGPTTKDFLNDQLNLRVHVMAQKPTPEDVVSVVTNCDGSDQ